MELKLYLIVYQSSFNAEIDWVHAVGKDISYSHAKLIVQKYMKDEYDYEEDIENIDIWACQIVDYVDGFNIKLEERTKD